MITIDIYSQAVSPKINYVFDFILGGVENIVYSVTDDYDLFISSDADVLINYSDIILPSTINIPYSNYFESKQFSDFHSELIFVDQAINFDFIAAIFYLLNRVEEYSSTDLDEHGRYRSASSFLHNKNLLHKPIVDIWLQEFYKIIATYYSIELKIVDQFNVVSTVDIDHIFAFKAKGIINKLGSTARDILTANIQKLKDRAAPHDPFDTYAFIQECHEMNGLDCRYFILTSERTKYDRSLSPDNPEFLKVIDALAANNEIGIHPSYNSYKDVELITSQKQRLEKIIDRKITTSRQHFLRMKLPDTYYYLIKSGITTDYSMGYPDVLGFRAGTSRAYNWYDVASDKVTDLVVQPFALMDVTLRRVSKGDPSVAFRIAKSIIDDIKAVNGTFSLIWHNSSFYSTEGWSGWDKLYAEILTYAKSHIS